MCYPWLHVSPQLRGYSSPHPNLLEHLGETGSFQDANGPGCQPLRSLHWTLVIPHLIRNKSLSLTFLATI